MCGYFAFISSKNKQYPSKQFESAFNLLSHRGPDFSKVIYGKKNNFSYILDNCLCVRNSKSLFKKVVSVKSIKLLALNCPLNLYFQLELAIFLAFLDFIFLLSTYLAWLSHKMVYQVRIVYVTL